MDFSTAPEVQAVIQKRASHGVFGYSVVSDEWYQAYTGWWQRRQVLENSLKYSAGRYEIDFEDLEQKLSDPQTTLMILCNPHNPVGNEGGWETTFD